MNPTVAIQDGERQQGHDYSQDFPALFRKPANDDAIRHIDVFTEIDRQFRFRLVYDADKHGNPTGNPQVLDTKRGILLEEPRLDSADEGENRARETLWCIAFKGALAHRSAVWAAERDLRQQESEEQHREFDRLMELAGYVRDANGELQPTQQKFKELLALDPKLAMDGLFGKGWKDRK